MCRRHKRAVRIPLECFIVFIILISSNVDDTHTQMDIVAPSGAVHTAITFLRFKNADATTVWTRKHSSRMRTAHLETVGASASVTTTRCCAGEVSLVWCPGGTRVDLSGPWSGVREVPGLTFQVGGGRGPPRSGDMVGYSMDINLIMYFMLPHPTLRVQTDACKNITFLQRYLRVVTSHLDIQIS